MAQFKIHPIPMGNKIFDKGMMTYQFGYRSYLKKVFCPSLCVGPAFLSRLFLAGALEPKSNF
jgi:hypothetical protein